MKEEQLICLPESFMERMKGLLGEEYQDFIESYQKDRVQGLRLNPWKTDWMEEKDLAGLEEQFGLKKIPWAKEGYYYKAETRPGKHPLHEAGAYYIQEPSAMAVAELLDPQPGEKVLDLCAAPGGKTTQIAGKMGQKGFLVSNEIHPARAKILSQNVERMGIGNAVVTNEDSAGLLRFFPEFFHRIVVDAPCSGEGMFRKDEQARQEWSPANVRLCAKRQAEILDHAAGMLMDGGRLVYSTCTFAPEENEQSIGQFLERHPEFYIEDVGTPAGFEQFGPGRPEWVQSGCKELSRTFRIWPHKTEGEGHYLAVLRKGRQGAAEACDHSTAEKKNRNHKKDKGRKNDKRADKSKVGMRISDMEDIWRGFAPEILREDIFKEDSERFDPILAGDTFTLFGEELYMVPPQMTDMSGLKVLRAGLDLGTRRKNRFEPSHGLALYLKKDQVKRWISLPKDGELIQKYLRGETIEINELPNGADSQENGVGCLNENGWVLIMADGCSMGWAKLVGSTLKNHYPKGLRRP